MSKIAETSSLGRITEESDVATMAAFLASEEARAVTGRTIPIHCGLHINF